MRQDRSSLLRLGAVLGFLGVSAGTFGAHGLDRVTADAQALDWWRTGVLYHLVHALAIVLAAAVPGGEGGGAARGARFAGFAFAFGVVVFSGTLYGLALGAPRWFGAITPIGGVAFLVGWVALARAR